MNDFERPLNNGCILKITIMSVPMSIPGLYLRILRNLFGKIQKKMKNKSYINFWKTVFHYLQRNFLKKGIILIDH